MKEILSVSEISNSIKYLIEESFDSVSVIGEISNFKPHISGHWYFTLKDDNAQINCTMWKSLNTNVFFTPQDGMKVLITGKVSVYTPRGSYQIDARSMKPAGLGELHMAFEKLKAKLEEKGYFDYENKKAIPQFPENIAILTAIDGAAIKDMISVAKRRYPLVNLYTIPTKVQGENAANDIANNICFINNKAAELKIDLIIIGRGGGSIEDLWAFNEEVVAKAIYKSKIPIISAVGHETDFTISDYVADVRAATPTAAMELATPNIVEISDFLNYFINESFKSLRKKASNTRKDIDDCIKSKAFKSPENLIKNKYQILDNLFYKFENEFNTYYNSLRNKVELLKSKLEIYDYHRVLKKGFVLIKQDSKIINRAIKLEKNNDFLIEFYDKKILVKKYESEERN